MEFTSASDGTVTAVRFYQGPDNAGSDNATLWTSDGTKIASAPIPPGPSGWREIRFDDPVPVEADRIYVVSYRASQGTLFHRLGHFRRRPKSQEWLAYRNRRSFHRGDRIPRSIQQGNELLRRYRVQAQRTNAATT